MTPVQGPDREERLNQMVLTYERDLLRLCAVYLRDIDLARDAVQETFLKAYRCMDRFKGNASEKTWLMRIAINTCKDMLRGAWFQHVDRSACLDDLPLPVSLPSVEHIALTTAIMALPRKYMEVILVLLTTTVAVAEALGLFGQIGQQEHSDGRLPKLEQVSTEMDKVFDVGNGVTVTVHQAYYDGSRVFISYAVDGPHDVLEMGTGDPGIVNYDREETGVRFKEQYFVDGPNGKPLMGWLDGSEPRWATRTVVNVHDGLQIGEEYLDIIGGEYYWLEDGTLMGWKECEVPAGLAADEVTFSIGVFTNKTTRYQTADTLYTAYLERGKTTWHEFTVKKNELATALTGTTQTADWTATANLTASAIDLKGEIVLDCPASWSEVWRTWENPNQIDFIEDWKLYVDGKKVEGHNLDGSSYGSGPITFMVCYQMEQLSSDIMLVPDYWYGGEKPDEAIHLTIAK